MTPAPRMLVVSSIVLLAGCDSWEDIAKETYSKDLSCPLERVTAKELPDGDAYETIFGKDADPAPEIKNNPGRYAMWKKERSEQRAQFNKAIHLVEVKGCDQQAFYTCGTGTQQPSGGQVRTCSRAAARPTVEPTLSAPVAKPSASATP